MSIKGARVTTLLQVLFERMHTGFRIVKDRGGQGGVRPSCREDVDEVIEGAGAARRDHGNRHG